MIDPILRTESVIAPFGISTALLTPFHADGGLNLPLLSAHATHVLENGARGVTLFGTTGEGASIGMSERQSAISHMIESGISADVITLGLAACSVADTLEQVSQGTALGITQFLLLPPFYFNDLTEDGLFEWHAALFERAESSARFILYHIPQITQVPLSPDLILRLVARFPERVLAVKDSAGQWENTRALLETGKVPVLVGDERLLHKAAAMGAAGSICGMANLFPERMRTIYETQAEDEALSSDVTLIVSMPVIPALKQAMVAQSGNADWGHLRPPLMPLSGGATAAFTARFAARDRVA